MNMGFLEAIGILSILIGLFYLFSSYQERKKVKQKEKEILIRNSDKCQSLIYKYNEALETNSPMSQFELEKGINKILQDKEELLLINKRIEDNKSIEENEKRNLKNRIRIAFKYKNLVFKTFDNKRELSENEIIFKITSLLKIDKEEAFDLLKVWRENHLIMICPWNNSKFLLGYILHNVLYEKNDDDLPYNEWLSKNNIVLENKSNERIKYSIELENKKQEMLNNYNSQDEVFFN